MHAALPALFFNKQLNIVNPEALQSDGAHYYYSLSGTVFAKGEVCVIIIF